MSDVNPYAATNLAGQENSSSDPTQAEKTYPIEFRRGSMHGLALVACRVGGVLSILFAMLMFLCHLFVFPGNTDSLALHSTTTFPMLIGIFALVNAYHLANTPSCVRLWLRGIEIEAKQPVKFTWDQIDRLSGLGLDAQTASVREYVANQGELVAEYTEVESGKKSDRPQLGKALAHARRIGGTLVIAKLDRLARNVAFTATLMESGTDFLAVDNPTANKLTIHVLAAVAEDEARRISERTKAALAAYKTRGGKLGSLLRPRPNVGRDSSWTIRFANPCSVIYDLKER